MASLLLNSRASSCAGHHMKQSNIRDPPVSRGPSPSLWPEPARPIPAAARKVQSNAILEIPSDASRSLEGAVYTTQGSVDTECGVSSGTSTSAGVGSGSPAFPSSDSTAHIPSSRPIDNNAVPNVFEPRYPTWHSYPPIHPMAFDSSKSTGPITGGPLDLTVQFLKQSSRFQKWVNKENAARIQLRHSPVYEMLVGELHKYQYIAEHATMPRGRAYAKQQILRIKEEMIEQRKNISAAELQHIRNIEKAWISLVSIASYERAASRLRPKAFEAPAEPDRPLSKVELLLGSDGSSHGISRWTQSRPTTRQPALSKMSHEDAAVEFADQNATNLQQQPSGVPGNVVDSWPNRPHKILIPDWFPIAEAQGNIEMSGVTVEDRFKSLLNYIHQLESAKSQCEYKEKHPNEEGIWQDCNWDKHWHEPNPEWPHEIHRKKGGLWKCRKGPTATAAENQCKLCSDVTTPSPPPPAQLLDDVMKHIKEAMAAVAGNDKETVSKRIVDENSRKPAKLKTPPWQADDNVRRWDFQQSNPVITTGPETISFSTHQPYLNYNPLTGIEDLPSTQASSQADVQNIPQDEDAGKGKGKQVSRSIYTNEDTT
ncbi:hypothetical protein F4825DRAFT_83417 [Nemania diffusa]|nr:hypothetical protein F4825DRAFT_83417 [Nemania diffusa]